MPTSFAQAVASRPVPEIVKALGCPVRTAFSWKSGERLPPEWLQKLIMDRLKAPQK